MKVIKNIVRNKSHKIFKTAQQGTKNKNVHSDFLPDNGKDGKKILVVCILK